MTKRLECLCLIHITPLSHLQGKAITALVYLSVPVANLSFMLAHEVVSARSQQFTQEHSNYNTESSLKSDNKAQVKFQLLQ